MRKLISISEFRTKNSSIELSKENYEKIFGGRSNQTTDTWGATYAVNGCPRTETRDYTDAQRRLDGQIADFTIDCERLETITIT